jgi:hypothetical protein
VRLDDASADGHFDAHSTSSGRKEGIEQTLQARRIKLGARVFNAD